MATVNRIPTDLLTANHADAQYPIGFTVDAGYGKKYRYGQMNVGGTHANTLIVGRPVYWDDRPVMPSGADGVDGAHAVLSSDAAGTEGDVSGVLVCAVTDGNFSFAQYEGEAEVLVTNAATALSPLVADDTNGVLKVAAGSEAAPHVAKNLETGANPSTPATTTCVLYIPE